MAENCGVIFFNVDYRLAPEAKCPENVKDFYSVLKYVVREEIWKPFWGGDIVSKSEQWKNVLLGGQCRHSWCGFIQGEIMTKIHKNNFPLLEGCHHGRERRGTSDSFTVCYARASNCEDYHHHKGTSPVRKMSSFGQCPKSGGEETPARICWPFFHHVVPYILTSISCYVILFGHF